VSAAGSAPAAETAPADALRSVAPVRVAFFSDAFPERNGTGAYYVDLLRQLEGRVEALQVFQPRPEGERPRSASHARGLGAAPGYAAPCAASAKAAMRYARMIVVAVTPGLYGLLGAWEARRCGATFSISAFHTDFEQLARMYWNPVSRFFVNIVLRTANRIVCGASESVLVNNERLQDDVRRLGARRVEVIGTPLPWEFLERPPRPISPRLQRVCFAGRLAPEKNVEHIVRAARELPDIEFVIGGDGPRRAALQALAEDAPNVRFTGWLNRAELIDLIDSSSLLMLPSAFETFGSIALEAMARGRPALVSERSGICAWKQLAGGLYRLEDPAQLGTHLRELAALEPDAWAEKSRNAREAAQGLNQHTIDHWLELLEARLATGATR
jgi:glycosyltransferase involved in cell wall biosynthesis